MSNLIFNTLIVIYLLLFGLLAYGLVTERISKQHLPKIGLCAVIAIASLVLF